MEELEREYYALICGVFNQKVFGAPAAAKRCIEKVWGRTKKALVFDALSGGHKEKDAVLEHYNRRDMMEFAETKLPGARALLHEDLVEGDLILYLGRQ